MKLILSLETSTAVCSAALSLDGQLLECLEVSEGFSHAEKLTIFILDLLNHHQFLPKQLSAIAVSSGPGSYTGLRIGASVAKGLCYALDIPLIAVPTLEAMAFGAIQKFSGDYLYCPMIDARRMEVYCALYDRGLNILSPVEPKIVEADFFQNVKGKILCFGDGAEKCKAVLDPERFAFADLLPSAVYVSAIANQKFTQSAFEDTSLFEPFYLKNFIPGGAK